MNGQMVMISKSFQHFHVLSRSKNTPWFYLWMFTHFWSKVVSKSICNRRWSYALAIETDDQGKLCYRSVFDFCDRDKMNKKIAALELSNIHYQMYDEGEMKEYGLTREERLKKQFIEQRIDELYMENYDDFLMLCRQLNIEDAQSIQKYNHLKNKIAKGYTFIHEILFYEFTKRNTKRNKQCLFLNCNSYFSFNFRKFFSCHITCFISTFI